MKKILHDWVGFVAAAMVIAAALYFLSPWVEGLIGSERTRILQIVIVALLAIRGLGYLLRFLGIIVWRED
ncbi:MAG: hypothetical protein JNJ63_08975 [Hyphomonadaceae bacterium]|nr:hypothetical protein [Hyphomonadaceae bacterium]